MTSLFNHLRSKVLGCSTVGRPGLSLVLFDEIRPTEISELNSTVSINENVLRLDVSMDNRGILRMAVRDSTNYFSKVLGCHWLLEPTFTLQ